MIIIDGLDKVGKTTLQEGLLNKYPSMYSYKLEKANAVDNGFDNCFSDYWREFVIIQKAEMRTIVKLHELIGLSGMIIDRFHGTEWSYLGIDKDKNYDHIWEFDSRIQGSDFPSVLIFLDAPIEWIWERLDGDERKIMDLEKLERFYKRFQIFYRRSKMTRIKISVDTLDIQGVLETTESFLSHTLYLHFLNLFR